MKWLTAAVIVLATSTWPARDAAAGLRPPPVRVHVFTARSGSSVPAEDEQGRIDSVRDLTDTLRRRSGFVLVDTPEEAQLRVEVVDREERNAPDGGFGGKALTRFRETIVRLRVDTAGANGELKGIGRPSWKDAAKDAADRLTKWVKSHPPTGSPP
jgi:hypothetical protein